MKNRHRFFSILWGMIFLLSLPVWGQVSNQAATESGYQKEWEQVTRYLADRRPVSAVAIIDNIYRQALARNDSVQIIKVLLARASLTNRRDYLKPEIEIPRLEGQLAAFKFPVNAIVKSILAKLYWRYYQDNRYQILKRLENGTSGIQSWNRDQFITHISQLYQASLEHRSKLYRIPLREYDDILLKSAMSPVYRPTLYDLLAHRALNFWMNDEAAIDQFGNALLYDENLFALPDAFHQWQLSLSDSSHFFTRAIWECQQLSRLHNQLSEKQPLLDVTLKRLNIAHRFSRRSDADSLYLSALTTLENTFREDPSSVHISYQRAAVYWKWDRAGYISPVDSLSDRQRAYQICKEAINRYPDYIGNYNCRALISKITRPELSLRLPEINPPNKPILARIDFQNVKQLYFRAIRTTPEVFTPPQQGRHRRSIYRLPRVIDEDILAMTPDRQWQLTLPDSGDFLAHSVEVAIPEMPVGLHLIIASTDSSFSPDSTGIALAHTWVSQMSYISRFEEKGKQALYVFDIESGMPLQGVNADVISGYYSYVDSSWHYHRTPLDPSDAGGRISLKRPAASKYNYKFFQIDLRYLGQRLLPTESFNLKASRFKTPWPETEIRTFFFTDRAVYRPGQTVYFKGLTIKTHKHKSKIYRHKKINVHLEDVNDKKIANATFRTNDFGSFSGEFKLPENMMTGLCFLNASHKGYGAIRVEAYKRPTFEARFLPHAGQWQPGDSAMVTGTVQAYAGFPIDNARVVYRIYFESARKTVRGKDLQLLQQGEVFSATDGTFRIAFQCKPDSAQVWQRTNLQTYRIEADIIDPTGETRYLETSLTVGRPALQGEIDCPEMIDREDAPALKINCKNLDDVSATATGKLKVWRLQSPENIYRERLWVKTDRFLLSEDEHRSQFPFDPRADENEFQNWPKDTLVFQQDIQISAAQEIRPPTLSEWPEGKYLIELQLTDKFGKVVEQQRYFTLYSRQDPQHPPGEHFWHHLQKIDREEISVFWSSPYDSVFAYSEIYLNGKLIDARQQWAKRGKQHIQYSFRKNQRGEVLINLFFVKNNRFYEFVKNVEIPEPSRDLQIFTETIRHTIAPGSKENWQIRIKGPRGEKVAAEIAATMFDASLDFISQHDWEFSLPDDFGTRNFPHPLSTAYMFNSKKFQARGVDWAITMPIYKRKYDRLNSFYHGRYHSGYSSEFNHADLQNYLPAFRSYPVQPGKENYAAIEGVVMERTSDETLPGVNVTLEGTRYGTSTDVNGYFLLMVPKDKKLLNIRFDFIGYESLVLQTRPNRAVHVWLSESTIEGQAVLIVAESPETEANYTQSVYIRSNKTVRSPEKLTSQEKPSVVILPPGKRIRTDFRETAFFFPKLRTDKNGDVILKFQSPDALTRWRMLIFSHTRKLQFALGQTEIVTQKPLMVFPEPPRFLREGDRLKFPVKIVNLSKSMIDGNAQLELFNTETMEPLPGAFYRSASPQSFRIPAGESATVFWELQAPEGINTITYRAVATAGQFSDGVETVLPILNNRILVTSALPLSLTGAGKKDFRFQSLLNVNQSATIQHHKLILEYTANPAWQALLALPYLIEFPYECSEQTFSRLYANLLGNHIVNSQPEIAGVFQQWQEAETPFLSPLEKNSIVKQLLLEESPWIMAGKNETERRKRVANLFNNRRIEKEQKRTLKKLRKLQTENGSWPWFSGMPGSEYITRHILAGFGHLRHLEALNFSEQQEYREMLQAALRFADRQMAKRYQKILALATDSLSVRSETILAENRYDFRIAHYLYMRSFYADFPFDKAHLPAVRYWRKQAGANWSKRDNFYTWAMTALALHRSGETETPEKIILALRENAYYGEDATMFWPVSNGYYWYESHIETQAMIIEAFNEIDRDSQRVADMRRWLLEQKQTNRWATTRATTEACYALLLGGENWLTTSNDVVITVGNETVAPAEMPELTTEAGSGYFQKHWSGTEIYPQQGKISVAKESPGPSRGAVYWQYFEEADKISTSGNEITVRRKVFKQDPGSKYGRIILTDSTLLKTGDKLTVQINIQSNRRLEYVHLKDRRAAALEPLQKRSGFRWQNGLSYYESIRDASVNFFFDRIQPGAYMVEYELSVTKTGSFSGGSSSIQCMYAPEFTAYSAGSRLEVNQE